MIKRNALMGALKVLARVLVPQFVTEHVALYCDHEDCLAPAFPVEQYRPNEDGTPDAVIRMRSLSWLGVAWLPHTVGEAMDWSEYQALAGGQERTP